MEVIIGILIFGGFIAGIVALVIAISKSVIKRLNREAEKLGNEFGLTAHLVEAKSFSFTPQYPTIEGELGVSNVRVHFYRQGSGKNATYWTAVDLTAYNPEKKDFKLVKENFLTRIGKAFGSQDIEIGDEEFDKQFVLKSKDEGFLNSILKPAIREQMKRVWIQNRPAGTLELKGNLLSYKELGLMNSPIRTRRMKEVLVLMSAFAQSLNDGNYAAQEVGNADSDQDGRFF